MDEKPSGGRGIPFPPSSSIALVTWGTLALVTGWFHQRYGLTNPLGPAWYLWFVGGLSIAVLLRGRYSVGTRRVWVAATLDGLGVAATVVGVGLSFGCGDGPMPMAQRCSPHLLVIEPLLLAGFVLLFAGVALDPRSRSSVS